MRKLDGLTIKELESIILNYGEFSFRSRQLYNWLYKIGVSNIDDMSNIPKTLRTYLKDRYGLTVLNKTNCTESNDGSLKFLFKLEDGHSIETVLLKDGDRLSGCISSQVGCRMGCTFCATSQTIGFKRNLTVGEIIRQVLYLRVVADDIFKSRLSNLVFMGMGEPLDNIINLKKALSILLDNEGLGFSHRKITVSTSGLADKIIELFAMEKPVNLAVSLNAPNQNIRKSIMPISNMYPLDNLMSVLKELDIDKRKRITLEYVLLDSLNDSIRDAQELVNLVKGMNVKFNLIVYNSSPYIKYSSPEESKVLKFQNHLIKNKLTTFIRKRLGSDIAGACGQLAADYRR